MKQPTINITHLPKDSVIFLQCNYRQWDETRKALTNQLPGVKFLFCETPLQILIPPGKPEEPTQEPNLTHGYAFTPTSALKAISNLLEGERPQVIERIKSVIERTDMTNPPIT